MTDERATRVASDLASLLARTVAALEAVGARDEALAQVKPARRVLLVHTSASMAPVGRAWRLGVLLLDREGRVFATGKITRAVVPTREQHLSASVEERKADRKAASRGRFDEGEVVNFAYRPLPLDAVSLLDGSAEPLFVRDGTVFVRWGTGVDEVRDLGDYLADRASLF